MEENYFVSFEPFARRHYIKSFEKKYRGAWDVTLRAITRQYERIDMLLKTDLADVIVDNTDIQIIKTMFSVVKTKVSPKSSGNRCILVVDNEGKKVAVLLVYHKNHLGSGNETVNWKKLIKENYPEYSHLI
ncbi:hypothetical protein KKG22_00880 [Patescibacteria group bacterium]|nr:hypothetical protein [Patescibacteria group bacterium]MBU1721989.1 hypothetical protein [Patescibacteria group bacterium]MBU1901262.1 hypothetical protein [Patescibacteria group bacterium]